MADANEEVNENQMTDEELDKAAEELQKAEAELAAGEDKDSKDAKDEKDDKSDEKGQPTLEDLEKRIADSEKANKGLYDSMKAERIHRQEAESRSQDLESRLQGITDVFSESIDQRRSGEAEPKTTQTPGKLELEIDDEGKAFIPVESLKAILQEQGMGSSKKEIEELKYHLMQNSVETDRETEFQNTVRKIVDEDDSYSPAYRQLTKAQDWFNNEIVDYQKQNQLTGLLSTGEALDAASESGIDGQTIEDRFSKTFPTLDMDKIARCYDSKRDLRSALKSISGGNNSQTPPGKKAADNLKGIAGKASNLGKMRNQKGQASGMSLDDIAELPPGEIEGMTDDQVEKLHRMMAREEQSA